MVRNNIYFAVLREGKGKLSNHSYLPTNQAITISQHIISYPISQGTLINIVAYVSDEQNAGKPFEGRWVSGVSREELEEVYQDFEPAVKSFLKVRYSAKSLVPSSTNEHLFLVLRKPFKMGGSCS
jgi:salicylate hydroxylase